MSDETPSNSGPTDDPKSDQSAQPKPRKRRRWPMVLLALFLVILALVALAPTIASTGMVRSIVVGKVNENLNGTVEIADWSLGWFSPTSVTGVKVYDEQKRLIVDIPRIKLGISILGALRSNFALGEDNQIDVDSFIVHLDETGRTNLEKLPRARKSSGPKPVEPAVTVKFPDISGKFTVNFHGTIEGTLLPTVVQIDPSTAVLNIPHINQPVESSVRLAYHVGQRPPSEVQINGSVAVVKDNILDIAKLAGGQKIDLKNVDLAALEPVLKKFGIDAKIAGLATGGIEIKAQGITGLSASGEIVVNQLVVSGGPLGPDTFRTEKFSIPVKINRTTDPSGKSFIEFQDVGVKMDQATVSVTGKITQESLINLSEGKAPGSEGSITIAADVTNLKDIASQLKNTLRLQEGVSIDGGSIHEQITVALTKDLVRVEQNLKAEAQGRQGGRQIVMKPVVMTAGLSAVPTGKSGALPDLRDLKLSLTSDFATFAGGGATMGKVDLNGNFDLGKLRNEVGQFADMGSIQLQGTGNVAINTSGDVADANAPIDAKASLNLLNVKVSGVANQQIDQDRLAVIASGILKRKDNAPIGVDKGYLSVTGGDPAAPVLYVQGSANLDLSSPASIKAPWWEIKCDAKNIALLQQQYGGLVPMLAQQNLKVDSGELHVTGAGSFDGQSAQIVQPLMLSINSLTVSKGNQKLLTNETINANVAGSVMQAPDRIAANFSALSLTTQSNLLKVNKTGDAPLSFTMLKGGAVQGNAAIALTADLPGLSTIAQSFGGPAPADQPQVRGGSLNGTITLAQAAQTKVDFNGQVSGLTVFAEGKNAIENEQISLVLNATAPSDLNSNQPIAVAGKIGSSFVNTTLSDVKVLLNGGIYDMLQSANVEVQAPDLAKLYALSQSFMPAPAPAPQPAPVRGQSRQPAPPPAPVSPPLQITSGSAMIKASVARDTASKTTTLNVTNLDLTQLIIRRGQRPPYAFARKPISLKLNAAVKADKQIDSIKINQLQGNSGVATIEMPQPIVIDNPLGPQPTYSGQIKVGGAIEAATPLISLLQDADPLPYQGTYQLTQQIATKGDITSLSGAIDVNSLKVLDINKKVAFSEEQVAIKNDVDLNMAQHNAVVKALTIDMAQSKALGVKLSAQIQDWQTQRKISGLSSDPQAKLDLSYDLEKLWTILKPMLSPEMQLEYKDLKVTGKFVKSFTVSGAYPDKPTFNQSIASLNADGSFAIELLDLPQGITLKSFELPITLKNGILQTLPAPRSDARRLTLTAADAAGRRAGGPPRTREFIAGTAVANDGAFGLDGMTLDLTQPDPLLSVTPKHVLMRDVKLNPIMADNLGKLGAVIMKDANKASGLTTVTIVKCDKVPLGGLIQKKQDAEAQIDVAVSNLILDGNVPQILSQVAQWGTDGIHGSIPTSSIILRNGVAKTDLTLQVDAKGTDARGRPATRAMPVKFVGGVGMEKLDLRDFTVTIDADLLPEQLRQVVRNEAVVALKGSASKPQLDLGKIATENVLRNLIPGNNNGGSGNSGKNGDILDQILGGGKSNEPPPPRNRGGR